ncbi:MAG: hypothetical protein OEQ13_08240, partial [Acidobacteriota bacterium]|nr:hypothetical protein [Acidobacteriota bacterium]
MGTTELEQPTLSAAPETVQKPAAVDRGSGSRPFVIRRRFIVDTPSQLRSSISTVLIVAGLLVMLNLSLYQMGQITTGAIADFAPGLLPEMQEADRSRLSVTLACSLV